jgi:AraC-like DNA-binding protein
MAGGWFDANRVMGVDHANQRSVAPGRQVLSAAADGISGYLERQGAAPEEILGELGLDPDLIVSKYAGIDLGDYCDLMELSASRTRNGNFGLQFGSQFAPERLGLIGEIALAAPNLGTALSVFTRYFPHHQHVTEVKFGQTDGMWSLEYRILDGRILERRQDAELTMGMFLNVLRSCLGAHWTPDEIYLEHPRPPRWREHEAVFGAPVHFNMTTNALVFHDPGFGKRMPNWDAGQLARLCQDLVDISRSTGALDLVSQVAGRVRSMLPEGCPHIEAVAESMQVPRWTLQRRLADQGCIFSAVVDSTRQKLALMYLREDYLPIKDLATILGYSEVSAFTRACVRWFDVPPSRLRARLRPA